MEKWKEFWKGFVQWPVWGKCIRWSGWTAWLKWPIWGRIGGWKGWQKLLFPHPAVVIVLSVLCFGGVFGLFWMGMETNPLAGILYAGAFYSLVTLTALLVRRLPGTIRQIEQKPLAQKLWKAENNGAFGIGLYFEQFINFVYGIFKIVSGVVIGSAWIGADGIYNFAQALIQLYQILRHKQVRTLLQQWKSYRQCGFMMIALNLTMTGMMYQMIQMGRHEEHSEIMIIATAAFTFYKLTKAMVDVAKDRRHRKPVDSAVRFLDFSQALYNLFVLQVGLLWVFGGPDFAAAKLMNTLTACGVGVLVLGMGIYMIRRANRDMRKLEETGNG